MSPDQLKYILPHCKDPEKWVDALNTVLPIFNIVTDEEVASFLSQVGHESMHLNVLEENLNYSQQGLRKVFSKYFPSDADAKRYARQPVWIASRVYANRMGNGSEKSQEGWKYRGRGVLQITGKNNYRACSRYLFEDDRLIEDPDLLLQPDYALQSACWFWTENDLNSLAGDVRATTKRVNGGFNGLVDREEIYERAIQALDESL